MIVVFPLVLLVFVPVLTHLFTPVAYSLFDDLVARLRTQPHEA
jgi:Zn-dependent protease